MFSGSLFLYARYYRLYGAEINFAEWRCLLQRFASRGTLQLSVGQFRSLLPPALPRIKYNLRSVMGQAVFVTQRAKLQVAASGTRNLRAR